MKSIRTGCVLVISLLVSIQSGWTQSNKLRIGIIQYKNSEAIQETFIPFKEYLSQELGVPVTLDTVPSDKLGYLLHKGEYDLGIFKPFPYVIAKQDFPDLSLFSTHLVNFQNRYTGKILVRKDSEIRSLQELRGKRFLFVKPTSTSGFRFPRGIFAEKAFAVEQGFKSLEFSGSHKSSLFSLLKGDVDGIAVDNQVLMTLSEEDYDQLYALEEYGIPYHAYVFGPSVDDSFRAKIEAIILDARKNPEASALFDNPLGITGWQAVNDDYYNPLRRYLEFLRIKPDIRFTIRPSRVAQEQLASQGDVLDLLKGNFVHELQQTHRFAPYDEQSLSTNHHLHLELGVLGDSYACRIYLDDNRILAKNFSLKELHDVFPKLMVEALLYQLPIVSDLSFNGEKWSITYGTNDGINADDYHFFLIGGDNQAMEIAKKDIVAVQESKTIFAANPSFQENSRMQIQYEMNEEDIEYRSPALLDAPMSGSFWDNLDNVWGVIGLVVAFLSLAIGAYFTRIKRRRFQSMLHESNDLLKEYVEGSFNLENKIIEQKDKITRCLQKGYINENQFLILKHRLEDVEMVINTLMVRNVKLPENIETEILRMLSQNQLTEREFSKILALVKKGSNSASGIDTKI